MYTTKGETQRSMVNSEIKAKVVRVVNEDKGVQEMSIKDALALAEESGLDLINLTPNLEVPTVKIGDYSKYLYEKKKKEKEAKKKQKANIQELKEVQVGCDIAHHDICVKAKNIDRLLKEGDKVNIVVKFKGRTARSIGNGPDIIHRILNEVTRPYKIDKDIATEVNKVTICISPSK